MEEHNPEHHENHESHEHTVHVHRDGKRNLLRNRPWVVSTFILGLLVILLILGSLFNIFAHSISADKASQKILDFATAQGLTATVINVSSQGSFYEVVLSIQGSDVPVYVTKDGKYFTSSLVPLSADIGNSSSNTNPPAQEIPKTAKPTVDLFVMSYCPYGTQAEKGILPVVKLLGDKIDFNVRFVYYSMHEFSQGQPYEPEMEENLRQYCIQKDQNAKFADYLTCFLQAGDNATCMTTVKIDKTKLNSCMVADDKQFGVTASKNDKSSWLSGSYPLFNVDKDLNTLYNIGGSPTLVINGVQATSARDPASYLNVICQAFSDGSVPAECGQKLSTTAYGAGFGYNVTTSGTTAAQCG